MEIQRGQLVEATTASGAAVRMRALGGPVQGRDFRVVWLCTEAEWGRLESEGGEADGIPWPIESVHELAAT